MVKMFFFIIMVYMVVETKTHVTLHSSLIGVNWVEVDWILYSSLRFEFMSLLYGVWFFYRCYCCRLLGSCVFYFVALWSSYTELNILLKGTLPIHSLLYRFERCTEDIFTITHNWDDMKHNPHYGWDNHNMSATTIRA